MPTDVDDPQTGDYIEALRVDAEWVEIAYTDPVTKASPDFIKSHIPRYRQALIPREMAYWFEQARILFDQVVDAVGGTPPSGELSIDYVEFDDQRVTICVTESSLMAGGEHQHVYRCPNAAVADQLHEVIVASGEVLDAAGEAESPAPDTIAL